jgi:hypothetical protein
MEIEIAFDSFNKTFNLGETITGEILIDNSEKLTMDFQGMSMQLIGSYSIKNNKMTPPTVSVIKFFSKKLKIHDAGKLIYGNNNSFKFKFPLVEDRNNEQYLYESYQGVLISISYEMQVEVFTNKGTQTSDVKKINVFVPNQGLKPDLKKKVAPYEFEINPQSLEKIKISQNKIPKFHILARADNTNCDLNQPFNGYVIVKESEIVIKSLELQFVRNENINLPGGETLTEVSEIQNLQIGDGDVNKDVEIPLYMIFPRFFSCASLETKIAKITFEMNVIVVLVNGFVITENFPINTWRS